MARLQKIQAAIERLTNQEVVDLSQWMQDYCSARRAFDDNYAHGQSRLRKPQGKDIEHYVAGLVGGRVMPYSWPYDVLSFRKAALEVKYACLGPPKGGSLSCCIWTWARLLGTHYNKFYDRLILVAQPNPQAVRHYLDQLCHYVLFDEPYSHLERVMDATYRRVELNSNPSVIRGSNTKARLLFQEYQVTPQELSSRY